MVLWASIKVLISMQIQEYKGKELRGRGDITISGRGGQTNKEGVGE